MSLRDDWENWFKELDAEEGRERIVSHLISGPVDLDDLRFALERDLDWNAVEAGPTGRAPLWFLMLPRRDVVVDDVVGRCAVVLALLERVPDIDLTARNDDDETALQALHEDASLALFTTLLAADSASLAATQPPLLFSWLSRSEVVGCLLEAGATLGGDDERPVMHRLLHHQGDGRDIVVVADLLLAAGASLAPWKGETLVRRALRSANPELLPWLVAQGLEATLDERLRFAAKRFEAGARGDELLALLRDTRARHGDDAANSEVFWQLKCLAHARNNERAEAAAAGEESIRRFGLNDVVFDALLPTWLRLPDRVERAWSTWQDLQPQFSPTGEAAANIVAHLVVLYIQTGRLRAGRVLLEYAEAARGTKESRPGLMDFNLACLCALTGDVEGAVRHSSHALTSGYKVAEFDDVDFDAVRDEAAFVSLLTATTLARRRDS